MRSTKQSPRQIISALWEKLVAPKENDLSVLDEITDKDLGKHNIRRILFDFENLGTETNNPPMLFQPLSIPEFASHPIAWKGMDKMVATRIEGGFEDFTPPTSPEDLDEEYWNISDRTRMLRSYLNRWAGGTFPRVGISEEHLRLRPSYNIFQVGLPNLFFLGADMADKRPPFHKGWDATEVFEYGNGVDRDVYPHVIVMALQRSSGKEDSMLIGELAPIIEAMRGRVYQPVAADTVEEEKIFEMTSSEIGLLKPAFDKEERFPVLMFSYVGPQHARIFYACMDGETLVIRQSKLYSFEKRETAPFDFFARWIMSSPLREPLDKMPPKPDDPGMELTLRFRSKWYYVFRISIN